MSADTWEEAFLRGYDRGATNGRRAGFSAGLLRAIEEAEKLLADDTLTAPLYGKLAVALLALARTPPE